MSNMPPFCVVFASASMDVGVGHRDFGVLHLLRGGNLHGQGHRHLGGDCVRDHFSRRLGIVDDCRAGESPGHGGVSSGGFVSLIDFSKATNMEMHW